MNNPYRKWMVVLFVLFHFTGFGRASCIGLDLLMQRARSSCVVVHLRGECINTDENDEFDEFLNLRNLSRTLSEGIGVFVGYIGISEKWANETPIINGEIEVGDVLLFKKIEKELLNEFPDPSLHPTHLDPIVYKRREGQKSLIEFVNIECETYITENGSLSEQGVHREEILRERFYVKNISNVQFKDAFHSNCFTEGEFCEANRNHVYLDKAKLPECEKLESLPSKDEFFHKFVKKSKPVIFKNILRDWPAFTKWSNAYFRKTFGEQYISFQMSPNGDYEGVEPISLWENPQQDEVLSFKDRSSFPDLVLVRPAQVNGTFSIFLDIIEGLLNGTLANYFQYSSIPEYLPELEKDLREDMLFPGLLINREALNIWLSDGNTRGKLHFDENENFLCQISGKKEVIMFDPNNNHQLYEGLLQEASLTLNWTTKSFHRRHVEDMANTVMSPVNMVKPDFSRFPLFGDTYPLNCTLEEGDVLYLPSFWWHEVQSFPNVTARRNLAINFWYEPFFAKEHPCPECPLDVNPKYRHLL